MPKRILYKTQKGLNMNMNFIDWTEEDLSFLKLHKDMKIEELSNKLNRLPSSIENKLKELNLKKRKRKKFLQVQKLINLQSLIFQINLVPQQNVSVNVVKQQKFLGVDFMDQKR